jgi:hypothetical protein
LNELWLVIIFLAGIAFVVYLRKSKKIHQQKLSSAEVQIVDAVSECNQEEKKFSTDPRLDKVKIFLDKNIRGTVGYKLNHEFHHFGIFNMSDNDLSDQPIWVSQNYSGAKAYEKHMAHAGKILYTTFTAKKELKLANLNGISLAQACVSCGYSHHFSWNEALSTILLELNFDGLIYCDEEIHISEPNSSLQPIHSTSTWE